MRRFLIGVVFLALSSGTSCQPAIFASSDSPDGTLRCEVLRIRPFLAQFFNRQGPWTYHFRIRRLNGRMIEDAGYEYGDGKIEPGSDQLEFKWGDKQLTIINKGPSPPKPILAVSIDSDGQHWKQVN
jgi:hypothetical protein